MTVSEARELLAKQPGNAPLCYSADDEQGTILEIGQIELAHVVGDADRHVVTYDGDASRALEVAVVA